MRVLVTRPAYLSAGLCEKIKSLPAIPELFPVIDIIPTPDSEKLIEAIKMLPMMDRVIFSSQAAVHFVLKSIQQQQIPLPNLIWIAIGKSTHDAFLEGSEKMGFLSKSPNEPKCIFPSPPYESESLLKLKDLQDIRHKNIMIFRGQTGRSLMPATLKLRGATVFEVEAYQRSLPIMDRTRVAQLKNWQTHPINVIITSSSEGLKNLVALLGEQNWQNFSKLPMIVVGERMRNLALSLKVEEPILATGADDEAILSALKPLRRRFK